MTTTKEKSTGRRVGKAKRVVRKKRATPAADAKGAGAARKKKKGESDDGAKADKEYAERRKRFRRHQQAVVKVLDGMFGKLAESRPQSWDRRAYLMLIGSVYARLASDETMIPTEELLALAKLLPEDRGVRSRGSTNRSGTVSRVASKPRSGRLAGGCVEVVRQVYGTDDEKAGSRRSEGAA